MKNQDISRVSATIYYWCFMLMTMTLGNYLIAKNFKVIDQKDQNLSVVEIEIEQECQYLEAEMFNSVNSLMNQDEIFEQP